MPGVRSCFRPPIGECAANGKVAKGPIKTSRKTASVGRFSGAGYYGMFFIAWGRQVRRQLREAGSTRRRRLSGRHVPVSPTFLYRRDLRDHRRESLDCPGRVLPGLSLMVLGLMVLGLIVLGLMGLCYMALGFEGPNALQRRRSMRTLCR